MKKQSFKILMFLLITSLTVLSACSSGGGSSSSPPPSGNSDIVPTPTSAGTPTGTPSSAVIGKNGGIVTSVDSRVTLSIPASALTSTVTITIQPITNMAHGGIGLAYELLPNGLTLQKPADLTLTYTDAEIVGTDPEFLVVAYQKADGYWEMIPAPDLTTNTTAKTITASINHFSGWSIYEALRIRPSTKTLKTGDSAVFDVEICHDILGYRNWKTGDRPVLGQKCGRPADPTSISPIVSNWAVNGITGGNNTVGKVVSHIDYGTYTAPSTKPNPDTVTVSVDVNNLKDPLQLFTITLPAKVKIIDTLKTYAGTITVNRDAFGYTLSGTGNITWTLTNTLSSSKVYQGSGSMQVSYSVPDCGTLNTTVQFSNDYRTELTVNGVNHPSLPLTYYFILDHLDINASVTCPGGDMPITHLDPVFPMQIGDCTSSADRPSYTDETQLSGSWNCTDVGGANSVGWSFTAQ